MRALSNFLSYLRKFPIRSAPKILTATSRLSGTPLICAKTVVIFCVFGEIIAWFIRCWWMN